MARTKTTPPSGFRLVLLAKDGGSCIYRDLTAGKNYMLRAYEEGDGVEHPQGQPLSDFAKPTTFGYKDADCHFDTRERLKAALIAFSAKQVETKRAARKSQDE